MAYTLEQLQALQDAYASGALTVRWADKSITYDSREQLKGRIAELERELGVKPTGMRKRIIVVDMGH